MHASQIGNVYQTTRDAHPLGQIMPLELLVETGNFCRAMSHIAE